mgnify:CR=1 FL=1
MSKQSDKQLEKQLEKCAVFRKLHENKMGWIIPNPWDTGSARILEGLGFQALATTSGGYAFTLGKSDGSVTMDEMLQHCSALTIATEIPVNADFENGYSDDISTMIDNIKRLVETGVAGISIEDFSRDERIIYPLAQAAERVHAAAEAIRETGVPVVLTARAESLLREFDNDLEEVEERLQAYSKAGADVLYAPAVGNFADLKRVTANLDKPFNVLASFIRGANVQQLVEAGANRISVGGALTYAAVAPLLRAGTEMLEHGSFDWMESVADGKEIRRLLNR